MKTVYNQLRLGNRKGLFEFEDLVCFYATVLNAWRGEYPEGKIDFMRFLMDWTRLSGYEIDCIMQEIYGYLDMGTTVMDSTLVVVNWKHPIECRMKLTHLMSALCYCVNHRNCFDTSAFNKAFDRVFGSKQ
jgi:hypothetical protein